MSRGIRRFALLLCFIVMISSVSGVFATWKFADLSTFELDGDISIRLNDFDYAPPMPEGEVSFLQRMDDILNQRYTTENVQDARKYLIEETIRVQWEEYAPPYVGSMDLDYSTQLTELFGDIINDLNVSFILKNKDLNYDGYNEISCYSTLDPLDCVEQGYNGIVGVYLTVFTPVVDENKNVVSYVMVCDALYGFCNEIYYNPENLTLSSFSTDDWRDNLVYWHHELNNQYMPDDAIGSDGVTPFKYHYESYHSRQYTYEGYPWGATNVWIEGLTASQKLQDKIPWIG